MTGFSDLFKIPTGEPQFPAPVTEGWKPLLDIVKGSPLLSILNGRTPGGAGSKQVGLFQVTRTANCCPEKTRFGGHSL